MKLEIHGLIKNLGGNEIISSLDLDIVNKKTLVLIGPSGSGKSTLLRLLAGLEYPDKGTISLDGKLILFEENALRLHRKSLGIVFQSWNLFPHLTALENIVLPLHLVHGLSKKEAKERSWRLLERFDLDRHANKKPGELSGGQVQRAAIIRAVASQPKILLLDEPTSALDPLMSAEVLDLIRELKEDLSGLVLVTHQLHFAKKIADEIIFLAEGKVLEQGGVREIFENPKKPLVKEYMFRILAY